MALPSSSGLDTGDGRAIGTARRIDQLGRIVVPAELRKMTGIHTGDLVDFRFVDGHIALMRIADECIFCGSRDDLVERRGKHLCAECFGELRAAPTCAICGRLDHLVERNAKHVCADCLRDLQAV